MQIVFDTIKGNDQIYMDTLRAICGNTEGKSMCDLMCNLAPHTPLLGFKYNNFIDILHRRLDYSEWQSNFIQYDVFDYLKITTEIFDVCICSDGIEHVTKNKGLELLKLMEYKSERQVLFTPLGNHMVEDGDNPEAHHSGWLPEDVPNYASIVFPKYHEVLGIGAFFFWRCENMEEDFKRVVNELNKTSWAKL